MDMFDRPMEFEDSNGIFKTTSASELPSYRAEERTIASSFNGELVGSVTLCGYLWGE